MRTTSKIQLLPSSDNNSARTSSTRTINTPLKRPLQCTSNGGTAVKITCQISKYTPKREVSQIVGFQRQKKSSRSWAVEKLWSLFFSSRKLDLPAGNSRHFLAVLASRLRTQLLVDWSHADVLPYYEQLPLSQFLFDSKKTTHPRFEEKKTFPMISRLCFYAQAERHICSSRIRCIRRIRDLMAGKWLIAPQ